MSRRDPSDPGRGSWLDRFRGADSSAAPPPRYVARPVRRPADRTGGSRSARRPTAGGQARRESGRQPYTIALTAIVVLLGVFIYVGLNWATGEGRQAGLGPASAPTQQPAVAQPSPSPAPSPVAVAAPSPSPAARTYVVKAGDNPTSIARQFGITADALLQANGIDDPLRLKVGQTLTIPAPR